MQWAIRLLATFLPIVYGMVAVAYVLIFFRDDPVARKWGPRALVGTVLLHVLFLTLLTFELHRVPLATRFELLSVLALALALVYLVQEQRSGTPYTGLLFVPLMFACQTMASASWWAGALTGR